MKKLIFILLFITTQTFAQVDYTKYVNPFIGTGGHGHTYPGAAAPFGFMQLSPDSRKEGWDGCGGYHDDDSTLFGFSHTHLSGTGVPDLADLLFLPFSGEKPNETVSFDKNKTIASPGYFETHLPQNEIDVSLTVAEHSGYHNYQFNSEDNKKKGLKIDLTYRDKLLKYELVQIDSHTLKGKRISKAWAEEQHFYFYIKTKQEILNLDQEGAIYFIDFGSGIHI